MRCTPALAATLAMLAALAHAAPAAAQAPPHAPPAHIPVVGAPRHGHAERERHHRTRPDEAAPEKAAAEKAAAEKAAAEKAAAAEPAGHRPRHRPAMRTPTASGFKPPAAALPGPGAAAGAAAGVAGGVAAGAAAAATPPPPNLAKGTVTGQDLPRWASLRSEEVNLRIGPGTNFQIDWVYHRRDLPVEIEREYEVWRQIEDQDGVKGWVHQATLTARRSFVVKDAERTLRAAPADTAAAVALLKPGVVGHIRACEANAAWCEVQVGDYRGFLKRAEFWGTFPNEAING